MVHVDDYGAMIAKKGERLLIKKGKTTFREIPLDKIEVISLGKGIIVSSDILEELCKRGISVFIGNNSGFISNATHLALPEIRLSQYNLKENERFKLAKEIIGAKIHNQKKVCAKLGKEIEIEYDATSIHEVKKAEAQNAKKYWRAVREILGSAFSGRVPRGGDYVNSCFDYAYGILKNQVFSAVLNASLDPYLGVIHSIKDYKTAFVFDVMEIFRPLIDIAVITFILQNNYEEFTEAKYPLAKSVVKQLKERYKFKEKNEELSRIILLQCYEIANYVRYKDEIKTFRL